MQTIFIWVKCELGKTYGVAGGAHFAPNAHTLMWPSAEGGALPVEGGVAIAFRRQIEAADDPEAMRRELEEEMAKKQSPFPRAEVFAVHELIDPRETRPMLWRWLERSLPLLEPLRGPGRFLLRP